MKTYKTLFFDLDHTLWDFEANSAEAISELFVSHRLGDKGVPGIGDFLDTYREINHRMWNDYHRNLIGKEELRSGRFLQTLHRFGIHDAELAGELAGNYLHICPFKTNLFPGATDVLGYLRKKYALHIITNGFKEVQYLKIRNSGLEKYFDKVHISEEIGFKKPEPEIFHYAVSTSDSVHEHCLMIGDNQDTDIRGARNAGIDALLFNPGKAPVNDPALRQIHSLTELMKFL